MSIYHNGEKILDSGAPLDDSGVSIGKTWSSAKIRSVTPASFGIADGKLVLLNAAGTALGDSFAVPIYVGDIDGDPDVISLGNLKNGTYTLRYEDGYDIPLEDWDPIGELEMPGGRYEFFISENIAPYSAKKIGVYDAGTERVGEISLGHFKPEYGKRLYRFGILSDVHNQQSQSSENVDDLKRALTFFNNKESVNFTCITGDLSQNGTEEEFQIFKSIVDECSPDTPVYATTGNHDATSAGFADRRDAWITNMGRDKTYSFKYGDDYFIFLGLDKWSLGTNGLPYSEEDLNWLYRQLECFKNHRTFIFTHLFFPDHAGNLKDIYPTGNWLAGNQFTFLDRLRRYYPNTIWFSGHSHWKWYLQQYQANANVDRDGGWTVHIPSCASPIDSDGVSTRVGKGLESEGAIVDVYEDHIDIRAMDLKHSKYIPVAQYRLDTRKVYAPGTVYRQLATTDTPAYNNTYASAQGWEGGNISTSNGAPAAFTGSTHIRTQGFIGIFRSYDNLLAKRISDGDTTVAEGATPWGVNEYNLWVMMKNSDPGRSRFTNGNRLTILLYDENKVFLGRLSTTDLANKSKDTSYFYPPDEDETYAIYDVQSAVKASSFAERAVLMKFRIICPEMSHFRDIYKTVDTSVGAAYQITTDELVAEYKKSEFLKTEGVTVFIRNRYTNEAAQA